MLRAPSRVVALSALYTDVRARTDALASPLSAEDQLVQSMPDVSPTKWHRAHTTWFFDSFLLEPHLPGYEGVDPAYAYLFNSYYENVGARHARDARGLISRPSLDQVAHYRAAVDAAMAVLLDSAPADDQAMLDLVELGLHHEQQHQELLLMDIKHVLSVNPLQPAYHDPPVPERADTVEAMGWSAFEGDVVPIGHDGDGFSFDNERPRHDVLLQPFAIADRLVTCGEWLAFIRDGGYSEPTLWLSDGWATVQEERWRAPLYWDGTDDEWHVFTLSGPRSLDPDEPVCHVSYYEADAFARWAGARLPREDEWEVVARNLPLDGNDATNDIFHPLPASGAGLRQFHGDVWEWTSSPYSAYPGFEVAPGAVGEYNGKFMVNQMVLRGGCCATPANHSRVSYRNFFPPQARWMFGGLRLAKDVQ